MSPLAIGRGSRRLRAARLALIATCLFCVFILGARHAKAVAINFNAGALIITDNMVGFDSNAAIGIIDFNTTVGGYSVQGTIDTATGPNLASILSPNASLRMTNFTAEALANAPPALGMQFYDTAVGTYTGITGADSLDAYAAHATGAPIPPANDLILDWTGFVSGATFGPPSPGVPPYPNPFVPPSSPPLPYTVVTHGPFAIPGTYINPVFGAYLTIQLGSLGDQLILQSSADTGFAAVPEPATWVLFSVGMLGLAVLRRTKLNTRRRVGRLNGG
jgi:hypothetical protein